MLPIADAKGATTKQQINTQGNTFRRSFLLKWRVDGVKDIEGDGDDVVVVVVAVVVGEDHDFFASLLRRFTTDGIVIACDEG